MPILARDADAISYLWEQTQKQPDGTVKYSTFDIDALWDMGFVDTKQYTREKWRLVFDPYKQPDGTYRLNKGEFYTLDSYRYKGEIKIPFDAMQINEGKYTNEGFQRLVDLSIEPSCGLPKPQLSEFLDKLKERYRDPRGLIKISKSVKFEIKKLLDQYPSPLRRLEIIFDAALTDKISKVVDQIISTGKPPEAMVSERQLAAAQASAFSMLPSSKVESAGKDFKTLTKTRHGKTTVSGAKTTTIKKVKRSRKGIRG